MLFEFDARMEVSNRNSLEEYLRSIWTSYKELWQLENSEECKNSQPFLTFDGHFARARKYIGFIHHENQLIEIYPKVFKNSIDISTDLMHRHILYWLSYCRRIKFPFNKAFLDCITIDSLPELIIYLIANHFFETISTKPYNTYEEVSEALMTPRGRINFSRYFNNLASGKNHLIDCDYEPFVFDNKLNRIIKYTSRLLLAYAKITETQIILNKVISILDEVEDNSFVSQDLNCLKVQSFFEEYEEIKQYCKMVLDNMVYSTSPYEVNNLCMLFPMEYIFEDFVAGFIKENFSDRFLVEIQKSELYLQDEPRAFNIKHDILLTNRITKETIIIDTKYKPRWEDISNDPHKGVSPNDMYQVLSYAYKRGSKRVILMYPNINKDLRDDYTFQVKRTDGKETISVTATEVPFWDEVDYKLVKNKMFDKLTQVLAN